MITRLIASLRKFRENHPETKMSSADALGVEVRGFCSLLRDRLLFGEGRWSRPKLQGCREE